MLTNDYRTLATSRCWPAPWQALRLLAALGWLVVAGQAGAQDKPTAPGSAALSHPKANSASPDIVSSQQFEFGMVLTADGGGFKNLFATVTIPADWPNQQRVRIVKEAIPPGATVSYRGIEDVGRQMTVRFPLLGAGNEVRAVVTFEVDRLTPAAPPPDASGFTAPRPRKLDRKTASHLAPSPKIESDSPQVRKAAEEAIGDRSGAWEKVQAIHQWVHAQIAFSGDLENVQTCIETLAVRRGVCAELNSLTVAMLRATGFPARLVRIPGHCYYEVYLLDGEGVGHWLAGDASAAATITPGDTRGGLILQKGDSVSIIDSSSKRRTKGRFLAETVTGLPLSKGAQLQFRPISPALKEPTRGTP